MRMGQCRHMARFANLLLMGGGLVIAGVLAIAQQTSGQKAPDKRTPDKKTLLQTPAVDFSRDVQPILKAHCSQCHSGAQQQGGLGLDTRALLLKGGASGAGLTPGDSGKSLLLTRILGAGGKPRMPLGFAPLTDAQTALIRTWIDQGAVWNEASTGQAGANGNKSTQHWAYQPPVRPKVPAITTIPAVPSVKTTIGKTGKSVVPTVWARNPIDRFVLARLQKEGVAPSPEADKITLLRRVTLDLTGLPPTPQEVDAFLKDRSPDAYERVVDRLLANPHYGERMALPWLDTARYADSNGFQQDGDTYQYVWRDWVVRAMNSNLPFDQFTLQQLAGDLLPNPTLDQKIATGFNRCHLLNGEGGAIAEEQRNVILFDRVDVTATTWLGATLACAQCHDHKYDPFTQRDYYSFMAFFNNVPESGTPPFGGQYRIADPWIYAGDEAELAKLKSFEARLASAKSQSDNYEREHEAEIRTAQTEWEAASLKSNGTPPLLESWQMVGPFAAASFDAAYDTVFEPEKLGTSSRSEEPGTFADLTRTFTDGKSDAKLKWTTHPEWTDGKPYVLTGENSAFYLYRVIRAPQAVSLTLSFGSDDAIKVWLNGKQIVADKSSRAVAPDQETPRVDLRAGYNYLLVKIINGGGIGGFYFNLLEKGLPANILAILKTEAGKRTAAQAKQLRDYFLSNNPPAALKTVREQMATAQKDLDAYRMNLPKVMVMSDDRPRKTHMLQRGNYEMPGDEVTACTPTSLPPMPATAPKNRLGLAQWLISPANPLTARVQVNRYWQLFLGTGLIKTSENLGTQSETPVYRDLLDWLATEFRESGWDVKRMHRLIVTSATYRQSSRVTPAMRVRDPENRLLARGARFRLPSLLLRDLALASSGLLDSRIGGKPVYPYQPTGIWDGLSITKERDFTYPQSKGADLFRRSLYTFWRRTVAPSNMFDSSTRTTCKVRQPITSTPLYALTTLNDITWVEAGRALAERVMKEVGGSQNGSSNSIADGRLVAAFRYVCARQPAPDELRILHRSLDRALTAYRADPAAATAYLKAGESQRDPKLDPVEHAAYASVCLAIYNLDEALTRE